MHEGHSSGWLQRTGQRWKLAVFGLTVGLAFVLIAGSDLSSRRHTYPLWPNLVGVLAMATAFLWFWSSVRCPACVKSVARWALTKVPVHAWFPSLVRLQQCPLCGDDGGTTGT